jgi:hypothetical protein
MSCNNQKKHLIFALIISIWRLLEARTVGDAAVLKTVTVTGPGSVLFLRKGAESSWVFYLQGCDKSSLFFGSRIKSKNKLKIYFELGFHLQNSTSGIRN